MQIATYVFSIDCELVTSLCALCPCKAQLIADGTDLDVLEVMGILSDLNCQTLSISGVRTFTWLLWGGNFLPRGEDARLSYSTDCKFDPSIRNTAFGTCQRQIAVASQHL